MWIVRKESGLPKQHDNVEKSVRILKIDFKFSQVGHTFRAQSTATW